MNDIQITLCGWVGSEVTLTDTPQRGPVASFRIGSTPRRFRHGQWEDAPTTWHTVKAWRALAEHVHASVQVGDPVVVQGRLVADVWHKQDGSTSVRHVVVATAIGHDLNRGTSRFVKVSRQRQAPEEDSRVREVIHSYDETGPSLDSDGEVLAPVAEADVAAEAAAGEQPAA